MAWSLVTIYMIMSSCILTYDPSIAIKSTVLCTISSILQLINNKLIPCRVKKFIIPPIPIYLTYVYNYVCMYVLGVGGIGEYLTTIFGF